MFFKEKLYTPISVSSGPNYVLVLCEDKDKNSNLHNIKEEEETQVDMNRITKLKDDLKKIIS